MSHYTNILFDWDGCLAQTLDLWLITYREIFAEYDLFPDDKTIIRRVFGDWQGPAKIGVANNEEFTQKLLARVDETYAKVKLFDHVAEVLETLRQRGKKLALITSSKRSTIAGALATHQLTETFDQILTAEDVAKHKPDPEIIFKAIELLGGTPSESIVIGDSKKDLGAAQNAGVEAALFFPEHHKRFYDLEELKQYHPTYVVSDFREVVEIVTTSTSEYSKH